MNSSSLFLENKGRKMKILIETGREFNGGHFKQTDFEILTVARMIVYKCDLKQLTISFF